jgi:5-methylthioadenosine/S-adenosylhomocysteine deaminase
MSSTKIRNIMLMTMSQNEAVRRFYPAGEIRINGSVIEEVGESVTGGADTVIDGRGMLAMPGLINGHNHFEQSFMNSTVRLYPGSTAQWIQEFKIPMTKCMERDDYYLSSMLTCLHMIRSGVTTSISHICQQSAEKLATYGVDQTIRAITESGVRSVVPIGLAGKNEPEDFIVNAAEFDEQLRGWHEKWNEEADGRVRIWPGPTGFYSATPEMWNVAKAFAAEHQCGIHTHLATFARGDVDQALEVGVLAPNFTGAHCVWLDTTDVKEMAEHDAKAVHNPTYKLSYSLDSEVRVFGDGIAPIAELKDAGCTVGLGQDGCMGDTQDLFKEMRNLAFTQHYRHRNKKLFPPSKLLEMTTIDCARTMMWEHEIGSIEPGKKADIILLDLNDPKFVPRLNIPANIVYQAAPENVQTVIINGKVVMEDRRVLTFDQNAIARDAQEAASDLIDRAGLGKLKTRAFEPWESSHRMD